VRSFLERVPKRVKVGLVAFSSEPQIAAPPTTDRDLVKRSLDELDFFQAYGGTAIGDAIASATDLGLKTIGKPKKPETIAYTIEKKNPLVTILFLSDGKQTRGMLEPLEGAGRAKAAGFRVYTVALGTPNGTLETKRADGTTRSEKVPPDTLTLQDIARDTGGQFFAAADARRLTAVYANLSTRLTKTKEKRQVTSAFAGGALVLLVAGAGLGMARGGRLP